MEPMVIFGVITVVLCGYKTVVDMLGDGRYLKRDLAIARQLARKCRAGIVGHHKLLIKAACGSLARDHLDVATHIHEKAGLFIRLHSPHPGHKS
jgi:hypothetical protein